MFASTHLATQPQSTASIDNQRVSSSSVNLTKHAAASSSLPVPPPPPTACPNSARNPVRHPKNKHARVPCPQAISSAAALVGLVGKVKGKDSQMFEINRYNNNKNEMRLSGFIAHTKPQNHLMYFCLPLSVCDHPLKRVDGLKPQDDSRGTTWPGTMTVDKITKKEAAAVSLSLSLLKEQRIDCPIKRRRSGQSIIWLCASSGSIIIFRPLSAHY